MSKPLRVILNVNVGLVGLRPPNPTYVLDSFSQAKVQTGLLSSNKAGRAAFCIDLMQILMYVGDAAGTAFGAWEVYCCLGLMRK